MAPVNKAPAVKSHYFNGKYDRSVQNVDLPDNVYNQLHNAGKSCFQVKKSEAQCAADAQRIANSPAYRHYDHEVVDAYASGASDASEKAKPKR